MPTEIAFQSEGIIFRFQKQRKTATWLKAVAKDEGKVIESLDYIFVSDAFLAKLNKKYLDHDTYTDIITFDYSERKGPIIGEIYISIPRVRENAKKFKQPFDRELRRVVVHGLLHLLGYGDKTPRQSTQMRRKEEACLSLWA